VQNGLFATNIPFEGYAGPIRFRDGCLVAFIRAPANATTDLELSRFITGHVGSCPRWALPLKLDAAFFDVCRLFNGNHPLRKCCAY
jgi:hypothetical protein